LLGIAILLAGVGGVHAQESQAVFAKVSNSIFLVEMRSPDGKVLGTGTAFLVAPRQLVTNAHVVNEGVCGLRIGPARLPCNVVRLDSKADLALISIDGDLVATSLALATTNPAPGSTVYVISNPLGMERTISQGLFSGTRTVGGNDLMQLSAPVSPGSSGGPVLDGTGKVVGVVVGSLTEGQLVNFAVPAETVHAFVTATGGLASFSEVTARITEIEARLNALTYSDEKDSPWQRASAERRLMLKEAFSLAKTADHFLAVAQKAQWLDEELAISATRKATSIAPSKYDAAVLLADLLTTRAINLPEGQLRAQVLAEALGSAQRAMAGIGSTEQTLYTLGRVHSARGQSLEAYGALSKAASLSDGQTGRVLELLCLTALELRRTGDAEKWLTAVLRHPDTDVLSISIFAWQLKEHEAYAFSGRAYDQAAALADARGVNSASHWCSAAEVWWFADDLDEALGSARQCIRVGRANERLREEVAFAYYVTAAIQLERGVNDDALINGRQAVELDNSRGSFFALLSKILDKHARYLEAVDAAKTAIRLTEGKHASSHFALGSALFALERWTEAADAFERAARLEPTEPGATYNAALCHKNLGHRLDAIQWLEETLRRKPDAQLREKTERLLKTLK
jgi:tetratricopeptide (TPR) repeat protein